MNIALYDSTQLDQNFMWRLLFMFYMVIFIMGISDVFAAGSDSGAIADGSDPIGNVLCKMIKIFQSGTARAIAVIGIIALGMQTLRGQLKWEIALVTVSAIIILFKAEDIVTLITGSDNNITCGTN